MNLKSENFSLEDLKSINFKKISAAAEERAMSDMRLASYFDGPENFTVVIDYSISHVENPDLKSYPPETTEYCIKTIIIVRSDAWVDENQFPDADEAEAELKEAILDYCNDNYIGPLEEQEFISQGISRGDFHEWFEFIGPKTLSYEVDRHIEVDIRAWEE